jgi:hypothetical protein
MGYATVSGVEWVALTDGDEWRLFNSHAPVPVEEKLFRKIRISDESAVAEETLSLLAKERMEEKQINRLWASHFVDRQLEAAIMDLFKVDPDPGLLRLLRKRLPSLKPKDIESGLRRVEVRFGFPNSPRRSLRKPRDEVSRQQKPEKTTGKEMLQLQER